MAVKSLIELGDVTPHNIQLLKTVNSAIFPIVYNEKFYSDVLQAGDLTKLAYYNDIVVGAVCCRVDSSSCGEFPFDKLYIMTLGCLAPYRHLGIGRLLLSHVVSIVNRSRNFDAVTLHVQVGNEAAIAFYRKFGFHVKETQDQYYKRIEPSDAHVLELTLTPGQEWRLDQVDEMADKLANIL